MISNLSKAWRVNPITHEHLWVAGASAIPELPQRFRIAVWNICKGGGGRALLRDLKQLASTSELLLLQEALLSRKTLERFADQGFNIVHAGSYTRRDELRDGVATLSRAPFLEQKLRIQSKFSEPIFNTPKVAFASWHRVLGLKTTLMVVNIHATLIRRAGKAKEEIEHLIENLPSHTGPAIVCGDFNTFTRTHFRVMKNVLAKIGFEYVHIEDDPRGFLSKLDHVFLRGVRCVEATVMHDVVSSDHFPLTLELEVISAT
jgi:endonuclease/exonuclease/phosphatase (EEP) superfamily protein YafD